MFKLRVPKDLIESWASRYSEFYDDSEVEALGQTARTAGYLTADQFEAGVRPDCTMLGTVSQTELSDLARWLTEEFEGLVTIGEWSAGGRLPGWCFEFGAEHTPRRNEGLQSLTMLAQDIAKESTAAESLELPEMFAALAPDVVAAEVLYAASGHSAQWSAEHRRMWQHLASLSQSIGISRRSLFALAILCTLVEARSGATNWTPRWLNRWLFLDKSGRSRKRPLGLDDPLRYVASIVEAMQTIWDQCASELQSFRTFRMPSPWILTGLTHDGVEKTLMAYCGGAFLRADGSFLIKCGLSPLVLGQDESCSVCHRLICHKCGYCSAECEPNRREAHMKTGSIRDDPIG